MNPPAERVYGLDILRWLCFQAILIFHLSFALWAGDGWAGFPVRSLWTWPLEIYGRFFALAGFFVLFISFFLYGRTPSKKRLGRWLVLFGAAWTLTFVSAPFDWDIYAFLFTAWLALLALGPWNPRPGLIGLFSVIVLSLPLWHLEALWTEPRFLLTPLLGRCLDRPDLGEWPLLPWLFLPLLAWDLGRLTNRFQSRLRSIGRAEVLLWFVLLAISFPFLGHYYSTPLGEFFGCFMFRQEPVFFLSHLVWLLAAIRISLIEGMNSRLQSLGIIRWLSASPVNQTFFLVYFAHPPAATWLAAGIRAANRQYEPWILPVSFAILWISVEWVWRKANVSWLTISKHQG